jgi:hypothetical protein
MQNYTGTMDFKPGSPMLAEVREIGEYEGVTGWAAGLSAPGCANVTAGSSTLTFRGWRLPPRGRRSVRWFAFRAGLIRPERRAGDAGAAEQQ